MSLLVHLSHTGQTKQIVNNDIRLEELRSWIENNTNIPPARQILMNARGKNLKTPSTEFEVFVYDKQFLASDSAPPSERVENLPQLDEIPSSLANENSIAAWQDLFKSRRAWAVGAIDIVKSGLNIVDNCVEEADIITRATSVAAENLKNHFENLVGKFDATARWAEENIRDGQAILNDWESNIKYLAELPIREDVAIILSGKSTRNGHKGSNSQVGTLVELLDEKSLHEEASRLREATAIFDEQIRDLKDEFQDMSDESQNIHGTPVQSPELNIEALSEEAEALARRVTSDYEDVLTLGDDRKGIIAASRKAVIHTRELLPALQETVADVNDAVRGYLDHRNHAAVNWYKTLQSISGLQSRLASFQSKMSSLALNDNGSLETLNKVFHLPLVYGATLIEAVRRSEWTERMREEIESTKEDISVETEEEQRRRRNWTNSYSQYLSQESLTKDALLDLKVSTPRNAWPFVSRDEITSWMEDLKALGLHDAADSITQMLVELDQPVKETSSNGGRAVGAKLTAQPAESTNDAAFRALKEDRSRLEDKLRAADSRVRKLEDLLHRSSQTTRQPSGSFSPRIGPDFERQIMVSGPLSKQSDLSRRSSTSLRRLSLVSDDKAMAQRIVSLESQIQRLQDEAHAERRSSSESRDKMQEAESIKQDLMANFEAQRQEFEDERQLLDDENHKLKIRVEELEDELDRVLGSRDHQKMLQDQTITSLRSELEQNKKASADEISQLKRKSENFVKDLTTQRERAMSLERQAHQYREERHAAQTQNLSLANEMRAIQDQHQEFLSTLQSTYANLSPAGSPPDDLKKLVNALEILSEGAAIHARGLDDNIQILSAEHKELQEKVDHAELRIKRLTEQSTRATETIDGLRESLTQEKGKLNAVQMELEDEQTELQSLRAKFAAGETGSDALKERLRVEEQKVIDLMNRKAESQSVVHTLKHEATTLKTKMQEMVAEKNNIQTLLNTRGDKARHLSERLFQHNDRIIRMLEQFGYSISRQEENLIIQRASKINASTTLSGGEGGLSMKRTTSGTVPVQHYSDTTDAETLYWTSDGNQENEDVKYEQFITVLQRLDLDGTIDTMTKRYKDVESLAKKYQKETRAYREKSHRLQSEAHDKIAYRSFREGDLALFLPTRNQATRSWAAFNVGAPHYFLREQDVHKLQTRDWLLARISKIEERVVDLSRSLSTAARDRVSLNTEASDGGSLRSIDDENPFELSDGLRWYLIDASEEKPGAPGTPSVGKSTVIASNVEVKGHLGRKDSKATGGMGANTTLVAKTLSKSLDSRRSSSTSKKSVNLKGKGEGSSAKDNAPALARISSDNEGPSNDAPAVKLGPNDPKPSQGAREDAKLFDVDGSRSAKAEHQASPLKRPSLRPTQSQNSTKATSPLKERPLAPSRAGSNPAKLWDKLFSVEYEI